MDQTVSYAEILTKVVRAEEQYQPSFAPIKIVPVCDASSGQFLLLMIGWEGPRRVDRILFHAQLLDGQVYLETDGTEEGLSSLLIEAGIRAEDILSGLDEKRREQVSLAA